MIFLNKKLSLLVATFFVLLCSACNTIKDIEYKGIKESKLQSLGIQKGTVKLVLQYYNPNKFGIQVKETQLEVYANDKYVGIAENPEECSVPKDAIFDFPIYVHFNPLKAIGLVSLLNAPNVNIRVKGTAKAGKGGVWVRVPVDVTEQVNLKN